MIQKLNNGQWIEIQGTDDLTIGDVYRVAVGGDVSKGTNGWQQQVWNPLTKEESERKWRDDELSNTDWVVPVTDHPQHADYLTYRQALRDYPAQPDFPNGTRPTL